MKITEVIAMLESIKKENGDINVFMRDNVDGDFFNIDSIYEYELRDKCVVIELGKDFVEFEEDE